MGMFDLPDDLRRGTKKQPPKAVKGKKGFQVESLPDDPDEIVQVHLRFPHKISGIPYSGVVSVPRSLAAVLTDQDTRAGAELVNFARTDKAVLIGARTPSGIKTTELPGQYYDNLDSVLLNPHAPLNDRVSGMGMTDPGQGSKF